jgi:hypothetical protein
MKAGDRRQETGGRIQNSGTKEPGVGGRQEHPIEGAGEVLRGRKVFSVPGFALLNSES